MIRTDNVEVTYSGETRALKPCSLRFEPGAFTVLLGASGAGKSTLLSALNGLVSPTGGHVVVDGIGDLGSRHHLRAHRRRTGMVFQQHQLIGRAERAQQRADGTARIPFVVAHAAALQAIGTAMALDAIERVGLIDYALRRADQLSGGQQQRVGIARALVQQPTLILADEPVASLDPATADRVLSLAARRSARRTASPPSSACTSSISRAAMPTASSDWRDGAVVFDGPPARLGNAEVARIYGKAPAETADDADVIRPLKTGTYA